MAVPVTTDEMERMIIGIMRGLTFDEVHAAGGITDTPHGRDVFDRLAAEIAEAVKAGGVIHIPGETAISTEPGSLAASGDTFHMGPGPHPSGSPQSVHGAKRGGRLSHEMDTSGGFTYQPMSNQTPKTGFVVAAFPERQRRISRAEYAKDARGEIDRYDKAQRSFIAEDPQRHLGGWDDKVTGDVFLDVTVIKATEAEGRKLGRDTDQYAIWDLERGRGDNDSSERRDRTDRGAQVDARDRGLPRSRRRPGGLPGNGRRLHQGARLRPGSHALAGRTGVTLAAYPRKVPDSVDAEEL
jgi:hypothetical protein